MLYGIRLLQNSSVSDDAEDLLISKLKIELGTAQVNKYMLMNADMQNSTSLMKDFKQQSHHGVIGGVELAVKVLRAGVWEYQQNDSLRLSAEMNVCCERFEMFFKSHHSGKNLKWIPSLGECEVKSTIYPKPYTFTLTTYQTAILLLYNIKDVYTYRELLDLTKLPAEIVSTQIFNLINPRMGPLLSKENVKTPSLTPTEKIKLNPSFVFSSIKISFIPAAKHKVLFLPILRKVKKNTIRILRRTRRFCRDKELR